MAAAVVVLSQRTLSLELGGDKEETRELIFPIGDLPDTEVLRVVDAIASVYLAPMFSKEVLRKSADQFRVRCKGELIGPRLSEGPDPLLCTVKGQPVLVDPLWGIDLLSRKPAEVIVSARGTFIAIGLEVQKLK